eukprot:EG_transcript_7445
MQPTLRRYTADDPEAVPAFDVGRESRRPKRSSRASLVLVAISMSFLIVWVLYVNRHLSPTPATPDPAAMDHDNAADLAARLAPGAAAPPLPQLLAVSPAADPQEPAKVAALAGGPPPPAEQPALAAQQPPAAAAPATTPAPPAAAPKPPTGAPVAAQAAVQRAAYLFFQAVGYQLFLNNVQAHKLHWADVGPLAGSYAALYATLAPGGPCPDLRRLLEPLQRQEPPPEDTWTDVFPGASLAAFTCGMEGQLSVGARQQVPPDVAAAPPGFPSAQLLWLTADLPLATDGQLSEVVPLLSYALHTNYSASRIVRAPSLFTLATRLWLALFVALVDAVGTVGDAGKAQAFDLFHTLSAAYVRLFPCGNCDNQFVAIFRRFSAAKSQLFGAQFVRPLYGIMMGRQVPTEYDPACNVSWANRRTHPDSSITGPIDPTQFLLPPPGPSPTRRLTVALDIDETLVSVRHKPLLYRPFLTEFLDGLRALNCEVVIWTASDKPWGTYVVSLIDPNQRIPHRIYRDPSWWRPHPDVYTKDLRRLGRNMSDVFILENSPYSAWMNKRNAILIPDYFKDNPSDTALRWVLRAVEEILRTGRSVPDFLQ